MGESASATFGGFSQEAFVALQDVNVAFLRSKKGSGASMFCVADGRGRAGHCWGTRAGRRAGGTKTLHM